GEGVARRVAHPLVAEAYRVHAGRGPHATAVVRRGHGDDLRLAGGPADRHVVGDPVDAPVRGAEGDVADRRVVERVPPLAVRLEIPAHGVAADRGRDELDGGRPGGGRRDRGGQRHDAALGGDLTVLQDAVRETGPGGDRRRAAVEDGHAHRVRGT